MKDNVTGLLNDFIDYEYTKGYRRSSVETKRRHISRFLEFIDFDARKITEDFMVIHLYSIKSDGISIERINLVITHLDQFCDYLVEHEVILFNPAKWIEKHRVTHGPHSGMFSEDEIKDLLSASMTAEKRENVTLMKRDRAIIELFYSTGIRMSELIGLDVDDVDFEKNELLVRKGKGNKERLVPVGEKAINAVKKYCVLRLNQVDPAREYDALFLSRQKNRISVPALGKMIRRTKLKAGITTKGTTHAFRRSCATHMLTHGAPIASIARILGHEFIETTGVYTIVSADDLMNVKKEEL